MTPKQPVLMRGRPHTAKPVPTRADCERIAKRVAEDFGITFDAILFGRKDRDGAARRHAWRQIVSEIGCSAEALAGVWGVERRVVLSAMANPRWRQAA